MIQRQHARAGRSFAAAALLIVSAVLLLCPGCEREAPSQPMSAEEARLAAEDLGGRLQSAIEHRRDLNPLLAEAQQLVEQHPELVEARTLLGQIYMMGGRPAQAREHFEQALALHPDQPELHLFTGSLAMQLGDVAGAEAHYDRAVALNPREPRYRMHLATVYLKQQRLEAARDQMNQALAINSSMHSARSGLAEVHAQLGQMNEAVEQMRRALELVPTGDEKLRALYTRKYAGYLRRAGDAQQALRVLLGLPPHQQFQPPVMEALAETWGQLGQPGRAAAHYEQALVLDPSDDASAAAAADWYLRANDTRAARTAVDRLRRINPRHKMLVELERRLREQRAG